MKYLNTKEKLRLKTLLDKNKLHTIKNTKGKIIKYTYDDFDFVLWPYEEQTKIKHKVLREYLFVWATKLGSVNYINYYDGFSGGGAYYNSEENDINYGSPIIAKEQFIRAKRGNKSSFYFNDKNKSNVENLKKAFVKSGISTSNITYTIGEFENNITSFIEQLKDNPKPTFFMIDPFGINAHFSTIKKIMEIPKTEVLFNFMYNFARRFTNNKNSETNLTDLFGTEEWLNYKNLSGDAKENALRDLYKQQLKSCAKYVYQYRMCFPNDKRTYYYLFHASNNRDGCSIMKDSFAKINYGEVEFLGPNQPNPAQLAIWDLTTDKIETLKVQIWNEFKGQTILYKDIVDRYIDSTTYLGRHLKQAVLLLKDKYAEFIHVNSKTRTIDYDDTICFFDKPNLKPVQMSLFS